MKSFGAYLGLDLRDGQHYHENALKLNTARNCLEYILKAKQYKKIYIPYYTCDVILEISTTCNVECEFYSIDESFEPIREYKLSHNEAFLYTNYYGLKDEAITKLANIYQSQLIVDNSLAFYAKPITGIDTFYTARKFFGVADGAYLYTDTFLSEDIEQDTSFDRMIHLLKRIDLSLEAAHADFVKNEEWLLCQPIRTMSKLTEKILKGIDYELIKNKRIENYLFLDSLLKKENQLQIDYIQGSVPMIYPFYSKNESLRKRLVKDKLYVTTYWLNVFEWCGNDQLEYKLAKNIMPLPVDQKYDMDDMKQIVDILKRNLI